MKNTTILQKYADELTSKTYLTNPAIARDKEIKDMILVLLTPEKSAILVGKPGIGKTAIVEGLAFKIQCNDVPDALKGYKIIKINSTSLLGKVIIDNSEEMVISVLMRELKGITKFISNFIICRWSVEGLGSSVDLNNLTHFIQIVNPLATVEAEDYFIHTVGHMQSVIMILGVMTVAVMIGSYMYLRKNVNKSI